jgi:hypothetical protein
MATGEQKVLVDFNQNLFEMSVAPSKDFFVRNQLKLRDRD